MNLTLTARHYIMLFFIILFTLALNAQNAESIIPQPVKIVKESGVFILNPLTTIKTDKENKDIALQLQKMLSVPTGYSFKIKKNTDTNFIQLIIDTKIVAPEGYELSVKSNCIQLKASTSRGLFYACQTLRQLLPPTIYGTTKSINQTWKIDAVDIIDYPRFEWRGMLLDVSRNFFDTDFVKKYIDWLSIHKINVFHWHLTDDQGWRIEIKTYPKLTQQGAWRGEGEVLEPAYGSGRKRYGGFYTQKQIKEIVQYAAKRNVNILPEIDVPGHSRAMVASYPDVMCTSCETCSDDVFRKQNVWCASKEENFIMLENIFTEVAALFPFKYIHIGGDEVNMKYWENCVNCKKLKEAKGFKDVANIQNYFIKRLEKIISSKGKKMLGWEEILEGGNIDKETGVMSWISVEPGITAAKNGNPVIMLPGPYCYFDMAQAKGERGHWWAGVVSLDKVYSFDPLLGKTLDESIKNKILGVQGALWSEYLNEPAHYVEYQTYPRLCALAEVGWTSLENKNWQKFYSNITTDHFNRMVAMGINFRVPPPTALYKNGVVTVSPPYKNAIIKYNTDGTEPDFKSKTYLAPFNTPNTEKLRFKTFFTPTQYSNTIAGAEREAIGEWDTASFTEKDSTITIPINDFNKEGNWHLDFKNLKEKDKNKEKGKEALIIKSISLMQNNIAIATDMFNSNLGAKDYDAHYKLFVSEITPNAQYSLRITAKKDPTVNRKGNIYLWRSEFAEPEITIFSSMLGADDAGGLDKLTDWNRSSFFTSSTPGTKADYILFKFKEIVSCKQIEILTGHPILGLNKITDGIAEVSYDGASFVKVGDFINGSCKFNIQQPVQAVKIRLTNTQIWPKVVVQDLKILN